MNCKELSYMLADYIDGSMDPLLRDELDAHLALCESCLVFTKTYQAVSDKARRLRRQIEYEIPPDVRDRLETFVRAAALKYPEKLDEYREQVERERREMVAGLVKAAIAGRLSPITALLVETHCNACPECREYFAGLPKGSDPGHPPNLIHSHAIRLMQSLPPGEEFFLA